jgi:flagellar hook assembly protein FlgD
VRTLLDKDLGAGSHALIWDGTDHRGRDVASGLYFCEMRAGDFKKTMKMLMLR